jgi:competence protein ComEA
MEREKRYAAFFILAAALLLASVVSHHGLPGPAYEHGPYKAANAPYAGIPVDINMATLEEFEALPGVGNKTALRILEKRAGLGSFKTVDELAEVKYMTKSRLDKIRGLVTVKKALPGRL